MTDDKLRPIRGALRSRTVAKLAGVTLRQLSYWHRTDLLEAHVTRGGPGRPRLYSWVDYMKVRAAKKLLREGLSTQRIRLEVSRLDDEFPDWHLRTLYAFGRRAVIDWYDMLVTVQPPRQPLLPLMTEILAELTEEGPLGELRAFSRDVDMHPDVVAGNPVIRGTRLETRLIGALVERGLEPSMIADVYHLRQAQVEKALEFDRLAA